MPTSAATLIQRTRRFVRDWPEWDSLAASCTSGATSVTVADSAIYQENWVIQIDQEALLVKDKPNATTLTVRRGIMGTTAASHANSATVLVRPQFLDVEYLDALNAGLGAAFPYIYRRVVDESITTSGGAYEYVIPDMPGISGFKIPYISEVFLKEASDTAFRKTRSFHILRDESSPKIKFRRQQVADAKVRIVGFGPYAALASGDSLGSQFPPYAEDILVWFSAQYLLASGEAGRVRVDTGAIDDREQANRVGSSMQASNSLFQRFQIRLREAGLPPMPKHVVAVF